MDVFHPACYRVDHSLLGVQSHVDLEIAHMWFMQSRDCAHTLRNLEIAHMCYAIPRLPAQSRDSKNVQRNLEIAQIPRLRGTDIYHLHFVSSAPVKAPVAQLVRAPDRNLEGPGLNSD